MQKREKKEPQTYQTPIKARIHAFFESDRSALSSASDLYACLKKEGFGTNLTTVYRNLDAMTRDGYLQKFPDETTGKALYQYAGENGTCRSHLHMRCILCGTVIHLDCDFMEEISRHAEKEHGFRLLCDNSILYGVCAECRKASNDDTFKKKDETIL